MSRPVLFRCPDVSSYQGNINFKSVRDAGYRAVMIRAGWGQNNRDERYESNALACVHLGIPAGIYWFSYALNDQEVIREARYAVRAAKEYWKTCPIAFDLEYATRAYAARHGVNIDRAVATGHAVLFLKEVKAAGFLPILYTNEDYLENYFDADRILSEVGDVGVWFAFYSKNEPKEIDRVSLWQYTSRGSVPGIDGKADINRVYVDIFSKTSKPKPLRPTANLYIKGFQKAANEDGYRDQDGKELAVDGIDGPRTQYVRRKIFLRAKKTDTGYTVGSTGALVRWLQERLRELGYHLAVDGKYGEDTRAKVIAFQKANHLAADGIAGYNTIQRLFYV